MSTLLLSRAIPEGRSAKVSIAADITKTTIGSREPCQGDGRSAERVYAPRRCALRTHDPLRMIRNKSPNGILDRWSNQRRNRSGACIQTAAKLPGGSKAMRAAHL